jgi:hypothetical protein
MLLSRIPDSTYFCIKANRLLTKFVNSLFTKIGRIRDPVLLYPPDPGSGMEQWSDPDPGSGIRHPGSATLVKANHQMKQLLDYEEYRYWPTCLVRKSLLSSPIVIGFPPPALMSISLKEKCAYRKLVRILPDH